MPMQSMKDNRLHIYISKAIGMIALNSEVYNPPYISLFTIHVYGKKDLCGGGGGGGGGLCTSLFCAIIPIACFLNFLPFPTSYSCHAHFEMFFLHYSQSGLTLG